MRTVKRRVLAALLGVAVLAATPAAPAQAGTSSAPAATLPPVSQIDQELFYRMLNVLDPTLQLAADTSIRTLVRNAVSRQFDGDTNTLWSTVIAEAEAGGVAPNIPAWQQLKSAVANFQNVYGYNYDPQIYIPNWGEGIYPGQAVTLAVAPANEAATSAPGYRIDQYGGVQQLTVDEAYMETNEVWVLSVNERITTGGVAHVASADAKAGPAAPVDKATAGMGTQALCNPTGLRNPKGAEYFQRWRVPNKSDFGGGFEGKREMRLVIITTAGFVLKNYYFPKVKKKHIDGWQNHEFFTTTWDQSIYGNVMAYQWYELDGGKTTSSTISVPVQGGGSISTTITTQEKDDEGGTAVVYFGESTYTEYNTSRVLFNVCSQGGDGGTGGTENLACGAITSASSTYPGYSPARATDCNRDTRLGGAYSWSNNSGTWPPTNPEWVQADLGIERTIRRVVVYTSQGYPIRDYDVQVWNGLSYLTVAEVRGNTALQITSTFSARNTRLIRILGRSGPNIQQLHVRVNELEVYGN